MSVSGPPPSSTQPAAPRNFTALALAVIVLVTAFRFVYMFLWCPFDLAPDEAHYWDWSRHLDWSYYSKGPLVAWLIRAGVELFGGLSLAANGSLTAAVRVPAILCGGLFAWGIFCLARRALGSEMVAFWCVLLTISFPAVTAFSLLMTIDAPYLTCWVWATVFGYDAVRSKGHGKWLLTGLVVSVGILAKYTMAVWLASFGLFLLADPERRRLIVSSRFAVMVLAAATSAAPILIWNYAHDWVTFRHVAGQAGVTGEQAGGVRWAGPIIYAGGQAVVLNGYWLVIGVMAAWAARPGRTGDERITFLWWMAVPTVALFFVMSFKTPIQINWPAGAYVSGLVIAVDFLRRRLPTQVGRVRVAWRVTLVFFLALGILGSVMIYDSRPFARVVSGFVEPDSPDQPPVIRKYDPITKMKGFRYLSSQVDLVRRQVREEGQDDPVLAGLRWDVPGVLGIYGEGNPTAYSLGMAVTPPDRHSQYDWWRPNPVADAQEFRGKTFVCVGGIGSGQVLLAGFDRIDPPVRVEYIEAGRVIAQWDICVCRGYRGFPEPATRDGERH